MDRASIVGVAIVLVTVGTTGCAGTEQEPPVTPAGPPATPPPPPTTAGDPCATPHRPDPDAEHGGTFTYIEGADSPESLDPAYDYETAGGAVLQQVYETLVAYDGPCATRLVPRLAAAMPTLSADGREYTFTLRQGVAFHDGEDLTAEDVKFSLDRIIQMADPGGPAWIYGAIRGAQEYLDSALTRQDRAAYVGAGGVAVVDDLTVRIALFDPDPSFLFRLASTGASIVSKAYVCTHAAEDFVDCLPPPGATRDAWMDEHEAGTGPFRLEAWRPGESLSLQRFDAYWGTAPYLDRVVLKGPVEDFDARLSALRAGEADAIHVGVDHYDEVAGLEGISIVENPSWSVAYLGFNQRFCHGEGAEGFEACMDEHGDAVPKGADGQPDILFFSDRHMRLAWSYAFDYETYYESVLDGHGSLINGVLPSGIFGYDPTIPRIARDLGRARAELAASGHPDGFEVTVFYSAGNAARHKTMDLVRQGIEGLLPAGKIRVAVQGLDGAAALLSKTREGGAALHHLGWAPDYAFPDNYVVTFAHSERGLYAKRIGYHNPALDALLEDALVETDLAELEGMYHRAVRVLNEDAAYIWLAQSPDFFTARDHVRGHYYNPVLSGSADYQPGDYSKIWLAKT